MVSPFDPSVNLTADGALRAPRHERLALYLADDVAIADAWTSLGGKTSGDSVKYRAKIVRTPEFKARLEVLMEEKARALEDPVFGKAEWQISQLWRHACAAGELRTMKEATEMQFQLAKLRHQTYPPAKEPETAPEEAKTAEIPRGPGRPVTESPQTKRNPGEIRRNLIEKGLNLETQEAAGEA